METIRLADGDPAWMFPPGTFTADIAASLATSSRRLRATLPGGRAGLCHEGLEYSLLPDGKCCVSGFAENDLVSFTVELRPPGYYSAETSTWEVDAEISVRCDHNVDCGTHTVECREVTGLTSPDQAVATLAQLIEWLAQRAAEVPAEQWREMDPER
ncbi:hypothetical protein [Actinocrispum wychmicini]|uniref:Uncharacterized protein n=1 Tax=Actinocrispum wychmicini TaxID=1213861 RepID=A0A4R2JCD7_9PSEU|nr:hypothetical protein [Actinocrispum wychmicini]TCO53779.1 hypothetical protein EV192_110371 [Actinocrispum wychmicini]